MAPHDLCNKLLCSSAIPGRRLMPKPARDAELLRRPVQDVKSEKPDPLKGDDAQAIRAEESVALSARKHAGGSPDRLDATRPQGAGGFQAARRVAALQQPDDVARREGVTAARAVHKRHLERLRLQPQPLADD